MKTLRMFLWLFVLTGIIYPLLITLLAQLAFQKKANGSLLFYNDQVIGSELIGQKFENEKYFWPRPSAVDYNPLPSSSSNLGPTSNKLKKLVDERKAHLKEVYQTDQFPAELLFASGSGLDPHISPQAAYFQLARVAKARNMSLETLKTLLDSHIQKRRFGFLGVRSVNILKLNLALDQEQE